MVGQSARGLMIVAAAAQGRKTVISYARDAEDLPYHTELRHKPNAKDQWPAKPVQCIALLGGERKEDHGPRNDQQNALIKLPAA